MANSITEKKEDIAELQTLLKSASRTKVREELERIIKVLSTEVDELTAKEERAAQREAALKSGVKATTVKLVNYAWDQTDSKVMLYFLDQRLANVHELPKESVVSEYGDKSVSLRIENLNNYTYVFNLNNFAEFINTEQSKHVVKKGKVIIHLAKREKKNWEALTKADVEKKQSEAKKFDTGLAKETSDPSAGIMDLMKKMYDDGDDDMKRTIKKAWSESSEKRSKGLSDMPEF